MSEKVFMFAKAEEGKPYNTVTYYRCPGVENFINKVEESSVIVGLEIDGNNIGFIIDPDKVEPT